MFNKFGIFIFVFAFISVARAGRDLSIVANPDLSPYSSKDNAEGGLIVKIISAAFQNEKIPFSIKWLPWKRAVDDIKNGKHDGAMPVTLSEDLGERFLISKPILKLEEMLFTTVDHEVEFKSDKNFQGKGICLPRDWPSNLQVEKFIKKYNLRSEQARGASGCIRMLINNRVDMFISDEILASVAIDEVTSEKEEFYKKLPRVISTGKKISTTELFFVAPKGAKGSKDLIQKINRQILQMQKDGTISKFIQGYRG